MKFFQTYGINYILVILLTFSGSWYFITNDKNKLVAASEKSIASVVTISSSNNLSFSKKGNGIGSGVIFSNDGYIVTNLHILSGQNINVRLNNGNNYSAGIIGIDENTDIAVLKITSSEKLNKINIANSENLKIGDRVLAIGNPYGIGISVSNGIISATGRDYGNPYLQLIQTDAAINPGNSGGALVNEEGYLVGINTKIYSQSGSYEGLGFAIPSEKVFQAASELIKYGKVRNAWIGNFRVRPIRLSSNNQLLALEIIEIGDTGPLIEAGVVKGDLITSINNGAGSWNNLTQALKLAFPGDNIDLEVLNTDNSNKLLLSIKTQPIN